jgi:outer membrane protein OmpA-like peptidoglycan-associated protein
MKKNLFITAVLLVFTLFANAQIRIAIAGGGHTSTIKETNDLPNWSELESKFSNRTGAHFGFIADLKLGVKSKFYFQPGILFYNKGRKFFSDYDTAVFSYFSIDSKQFINYIEAPLNIVYKIPISSKAKFFLGGGPYLSFFYNGSEKTEIYQKSGSVSTIEDNDLPVGNAPGKYKTLDLGINGTAGIEFGKIFIAGNFSSSITDMYKAAAYNGQFKNQVIGATLGIFIGNDLPLEEKPKDTDKDGILDNDDLCITEPGALVTNGCPDRDGDGLADKDDKCPDEKGLVTNFGCPIRDTDGDGVLDDKDKCVTIPGIAKYDGCPVPDSDNDKINDEEDKCPDVPGLLRYSGCPVPDSDGDGVNDEEDKCVTVPGVKENNGCPIIREEVIQKVEYAAKRIQFEFAKAILKDESKTVLDEVADILVKNPELKLDIEGHTSNDGNLDANNKLSRDRAMSVKKYLVEKGIDELRLNAQGFGPSQPLNSGKTAAEKALNRRVELKLRNN